MQKRIVDLKNKLDILIFHTNSEQVGGQKHSIPMLLSFSAAMPSGGFKLEKTSAIENDLQKRIFQMETNATYVDYLLGT